MDQLSRAVREVNALEVVDLRHRILRAGLGRETAVFAGDEDAGAIHLAVFDGDEMIGCATLHRSLDGMYQLRGMAVETGRQGSGVGKALLAESELRAVANGAKGIWANCRTGAVGFYARFGWRVVSEEFVIETAGGHFRMVKYFAAGK